MPGPGVPASLAKTAILLDRIAGADIARVERFAASNPFVLAMIKTDAVLAELPAEVYLFVGDHRWKIEQANFEIFDEAAGFQNTVERGLQRFGELLMFHAQGRQFVVG